MVANENERPFPLELLQEPISTKLQYFRDVIVPHRNIKQILEELLKNAKEPDDALVYLVFGVTGVGKTRLKEEFEKKLLKHFMDEILENPGSVIVGGIEVDSAEGGKFNYSDYYIQVLESLKEVLISYKEDYAITETQEKDYDALLGTFEGKNSKALRRAMQKVFINRQLKAFTLDEAQHLFDVAGGRQLLTQMNWIKSIANKTSTVHVLFGTYELLNCQKVNGQVGRRSEDYHLARYHLNHLKDEQNKADFEEFEKVIVTLQQRLPVSQEPQLEKHCEYFMKYSLGCVGLLKNWWYRSLKNALEENAKTVRIKDFQAKELSAGRRKKIKEEAEKGEKDLAELYREAKDSNKSKPEEDLASRPKSRSRKVGERKPTRDLVGINQGDE
jgi:hypothetical protein